MPSERRELNPGWCTRLFSSFFARGPQKSVRESPTRCEAGATFCSKTAGAGSQLFHQRRRCACTRQLLVYYYRRFLYCGELAHRCSFTHFFFFARFQWVECHRHTRDLTSGSSVCPKTSSVELESWAAGKAEASVRDVHSARAHRDAARSAITRSCSRWCSLLRRRPCGRPPCSRRLAVW